MAQAVYSISWIIFFNFLKSFSIFFLTTGNLIAALGWKVGKKTPLAVRNNFPWIFETSSLLSSRLFIATFPSKTVNFGLIIAICFKVYGRHNSISFGVGA